MYLPGVRCASIRSWRCGSSRQRARRRRSFLSRSVVRRTVTRFQTAREPRRSCSFIGVASPRSGTRRPYQANTHLRIGCALVGLLNVYMTVTSAQGLRLPEMTSLRSTESLATANLSVEEVTFDTPDSWESELLARRVSTATAMDGLVLQGSQLLCGGTGNCQLVVMQRAGGRWRTLFDRQAPVGYGFAFLDGRSKGVRNLLVADHSSADQDHYVLYRFDGQYYRASQCYDKRASRLTVVTCASYQGPREDAPGSVRSHHRERLGLDGRVEAISAR
jgi:hypothetical protein